MAGRELAFARIFEAPRELVWKAWTDPALFARWMGPRGFTTTMKDAPPIRPGVAWTYTMDHAEHGSFPNRLEFLEVVPPERLRYRLGSGGAVDDAFETTVTFAPHPRGTKAVMRAVFRSAADLERVLKAFKALEGGNGTYDRLAEVLAAPEKPFVFTRAFDAPRDVVWRHWTERDLLLKWFGPRGWKMSEASLDFRPGGRFHFRLRAPDGQEMWGLFTYREIEAPERIVHLHTFADAAGKLVRHPMAPGWPLEMLTRTTMTEIDGRTFVTVSMTALGATPDEQALFDGAHDGMRAGWGGSYEPLDALLATS